MSERGIVLDGVSVRLGAFSLDRLSLAVGTGERLVVIGPNGAGKSVTLETIAGFHRVQQGRIGICGRDVTCLPPEQRNVAFVFQNFGLFPHLSVAGNIALALHRVPRGNRRGRVAELLQQFGIAHLAERSSRSLSPGEKQRTALARGLAADPDVFLFDEPFSALDASTHARLRQELDEFLARTRIPAIFVSHDCADAYALGTTVAVMRSGTIVRHGPVAEVFAAPGDRFVAELLGVENVFAARLRDRSHGLATVMARGLTLHAAIPKDAGDLQADLLVAIRAEDIEILPPGGASGTAANCVTARIVHGVNEGILTRIVLALPGPGRSLPDIAGVEFGGGMTLQARAMTRQLRGMRLEPGSRVELAVAAEAIHLMPDQPDQTVSDAEARSLPRRVSVPLHARYAAPITAMHR